MVHFAQLDGNEFGILIHKVFQNCEECDLQESSLIWLANHLSNLDDVPLDVIVKKMEKKIWLTFKRILKHVLYRWHFYLLLIMVVLIEKLQYSAFYYDGKTQSSTSFEIGAASLATFATATSLTACAASTIFGFGAAYI